MQDSVVNLKGIDEYDGNTLEGGGIFDRMGLFDLGCKDVDDEETTPMAAFSASVA